VPPTSGVRLFLGAAIALVLAIGAAAVIADAVDDDQPAAPTSSTTAAAAGPRTRVVPAANQSFVVGTATPGSIEGTPLIPALYTPFAVTTPSAGFGAGATIEGAVVDGETVTIVWDAGRPFDLAGNGGGMRLGRVRIELTPAGATYVFPDGVVHGLLPGLYELRTPVAVGGTGLAQTRDTVTFEATQSTTISFRGGASAASPPGEHVVNGPGRVVLDGELSVERADGVGPARHVELPEGEFTVELAQTADGWIVDATLQGDVVAT
jgi:hypothetical protein